MSYIGHEAETWHSEEMEHSPDIEREKFATFCENMDRACRENDFDSLWGVYFRVNAYRRQPAHT